MPAASFIDSSYRPAMPMIPATLTPKLEALFWSLQKEKRRVDARYPLYLVRTQKHGMTRTWRRKICHWMFQTAREFDLLMDTVANAMHFLDTFLTVKSVDRSGLQLMGMVCLWVASKMHEARPILIAEMSIMCERKFSRKHMLEAEKQLATILRFNFSPPNCFSYARDMVTLLPVKAKRDRDACLASVFHSLELALQDVVSIGCDASSLALTAVQLAAQSELGLSSDKLTAEVLLQSASHLISEASLSKAAKLLQNVELSQSSAVAQAPEAVVSSSPTAVEEMFDYRSAPEDIKEEEISATTQDIDALTASLMADENEMLSDSESESSSPRDRRTRSRSYDDESDGGAKRRRF